MLEINAVSANRNRRFVYGLIKFKTLISDEAVRSLHDKVRVSGHSGGLHGGRKDLI